MPRPEIYPVKKVIGFDRAQLAAIDGWRRRQTPIPTVSEAIRLLVGQALAGAAMARPRSKEAKRKAAELAAREIDRLGDHGLTSEEKATRKRRLIKGPKEFRDVRGHQPKTKN
jgi:hypothetical protein